MKMATKEDVDKAKAAWVEADAAEYAAWYAAADYDDYDDYATAATAATAATVAARDKYIKLKEAYENGN